MERTAVSAYLRTTQAWCLQLCEKETLDHGIAYVSPRHAILPEACHLREVVIEDETTIAPAIELTEQWFRERKLRCLRWAAVETQPLAPLQSMLEANGFQAKKYSVLALSRWNVPAVSGDIRILPARAMRSAFLSTFAVPAEANAFTERLDDPHLDMFVAVGPTGSIGRCGLFQVGDIARVIEPVVSNPAAENALIAAALTLAKRLAYKTVLIQGDSDNHAALSRYAGYGFSPAGEFVEFDRGV